MLDDPSTQYRGGVSPLPPSSLGGADNVLTFMVMAPTEAVFILLFIPHGSEKHGSPPFCVRLYGLICPRWRITIRADTVVKPDRPCACRRPASIVKRMFLLPPPQLVRCCRAGALRCTEVRRVSDARSGRMSLIH